MKTIEESIINVKNFDFKSASQKEIEEILPTFGMNDEYPLEIPKIFEPYMGWGIRFWQYPNQFSKLLTYIKDKEIDSYLEIGVRHGGTFIIINELLMKYNPRLDSHCIDVIPPSEILNIYQNKFRTNQFFYHQIDSQNPFVFERLEGFDSTVPQIKFDLVFIDGCHSYQCVKRDYVLALMLGAKYIVFHDIVNVNTLGNRILWKEIKKNHNVVHEFTDQYEYMDGKFLGIGIVEIQKEDLVFPMFKKHYLDVLDW